MTTIKLRRRSDCCIQAWWEGFELGWKQSEKGTTSLEDHKLLHKAVHEGEEATVWRETRVAG